jgi:hypothetical protein
MAIVQVRDVSPETHAALTARAERSGMSLSEYLRHELERLAAQPTMEEMLERVASREPVGGRSAATILRKERARRG